MGLVDKVLRRWRPPADHRLDSTRAAARLAKRVRLAHRLDEAGWTVLVAEIGEALGSWQPADWLGLTVHDRTALYAAAQGEREDVERIAESCVVNGPTYLVDRGDRRIHLGVPLRVTVPDWLLVAQEHDLVARLQLEVAGSNPCVVSGLAFVSGVPFDAEQDRVEVVAIAGDHRVEAALTMRPDPALDAESGERWADHTEAAWWGTVDIARDEPFVLVVTVTSAGIERTVEVAVPARDPLAVEVGARALSATALEIYATGQAQVAVESSTETWGSGTAPLVLDSLRERFGRDGVLPTGRYALTADRGVDLVDPLALALPRAEREVDLTAVLVSLRGWSPGEPEASLLVRTPIPVENRGRRRQRLLLDEVRQNAGPLREHAVASCFVGTGAGDNVGPVVTELMRRGIGVDWCVADLSVAVPDGARPVLLHSREWHEAFTHARYLVSNAEFAHYVRFREGQRYLQTWHGTPLKRIANDILDARLSAGYTAAMRREVAAWEALLAQNAFAGDVLPAAFGFGGRTIVEGYPRNDALADGAEELRRRTRAELGLGDELVVLYAPTWRDRARDADGRRAFVSHLDAERVHERTGATVLVRSHSNTAAARGRLGGSGVVDVTAHPDMTALMAAADVLVTDYSSVMFDFAVTGRPQVLLVPDIADYRDRERGFYLDLAEIAPGPIVSTTDEVVAALADPGAGFEQARADFRARFAPLDDGAAARRAVDAWLGPAR